MPTRTRILFYASYPNQPIGYSKVAHAISHWLAAQPDVELHYFGIGNYAEDACRERRQPPGAHMIDVHALTPDPFGMDILPAVLETLRPDIFLVYNDLIVTCRIYNALLAYRAQHPTTRFISYIDLVYPYEKLALIRHMDRNTDEILVFSDYWRRNLLEMGVSPQKVRVFPHGIPRPSSLPSAADVEAAKVALGFPADAFLILNANRNTYRKAQDLTVRAFAQFLQQENWDPRLYLFLHCAQTTRSGYTLEDLLEVEACRAGIEVAKLRDRIRRFPTEVVEDSDIRRLYTAADVGINTCMGEGFGLCNAEHAAYGKPQIVSRVGALGDIFGDGGAICVEPRTWIRAANPLDEHTGDLGICAAEDFATALSAYFHDDEKRVRDGLWGALVLPQQYEWPRLLEAALRPLLSTNTPTLSQS